MMIDVSIKDGRTTYRFIKRALFVTLVRRTAFKLEEYDSVKCWVRRHPEDEWMAAKLQYLNDSSIGLVEQVDPKERDIFLEVQRALATPVTAVRPASEHHLRELGGVMVEVRA